MIASRKGIVARHARSLRSLALIIGFAFFSIGARDLKRSLRTERASCDEITMAQQVEWHRQQTDAVELHSLPGLLRLFTTMSDQLAAEATDYKDVDFAKSVITCGAPSTTDAM
ncbi:MAG TPA: hypothetical protein VGP15_12880 [Burkholderiales bacterium]|nr:hypothetical protein [Burkholderiales bacterium]